MGHLGTLTSIYVRRYVVGIRRYRDRSKFVFQFDLNVVYVMSYVLELLCIYYACKCTRPSDQISGEKKELVVKNQW